MAITAAQNWSTFAFSFGSSTAAKSYASNPTTGNLGVACCYITGILNTLTIADNSGDGVAWSTALGPISGTDIGESAYIFYKVWGASISGKTVTITPTGSGAKEISIAEYTGNNTTQASVLDGTNSATTLGSGSANPSPGAINTSTGGVVVGYLTASTGTPTAGTGFTRQLFDNSINSDAIEDKFTSASGSYTANWTNASSVWIALAAAFKAAGGGGFTPVNRRSLGARVGARSTY